MLRGIESNRIIVGAYTDKRGGVCPMLAAHRNGGRTDYATFARSWDAYTGAGRKARRASRREVRILHRYLEASLAGEGWTRSTTDEPVRAGSLAEEVRAVQAARRRLAELDAREGSETTIEDILAQAELQDVLRPGLIEEEPDTWEHQRDEALRAIDDASLTSAP